MPSWISRFQARIFTNTRPPPWHVPQQAIVSRSHRINHEFLCPNIGSKEDPILFCNTLIRIKNQDPTPGSMRERKIPCFGKVIIPYMMKDRSEEHTSELQSQ